MVPFSVKKLLKFIVFVIVFFILFYKARVIDRQPTSSSSFSDGEIVSLLNRAKDENAKRLLRVEKICQDYNLGIYKSNSRPIIYKEPPTPHYEIFFYDRKHKLSWCPIYKAGSSTWLYNLALLGGSTDEGVTNSKLQINDFVRHIFPPFSSEEAIAFLPNSLKFMIVRHPFERILSAYRDKLENVAIRTKSGTFFYYKKYGRKIVSKYRAGGNNTNIRSLLKRGQYIWNDENKPEGIEPTFKEFVRYLIDVDLRLRADDHWIPFYLYCTPCSLKFNIIGKVETMQQDQILIIHSSKLENKLQPHWRHRTNPFNQTANSAVSEVAKIYFSQLTKKDVNDLYMKYKLDFLLFDYNEKEYFKYAAE